MAYKQITADAIRQAGALADQLMEQWLNSIADSREGDVPQKFRADMKTYAKLLQDIRWKVQQDVLVENGYPPAPPR